MLSKLIKMYLARKGKENCENQRNKSRFLTPFGIRIKTTFVLKMLIEETILK
jgi:hypothetical protein